MLVSFVITAVRSPSIPVGALVRGKQNMAVLYAGLVGLVVEAGGSKYCRLSGLVVTWKAPLQQLLVA